MPDGDLEDGEVDEDDDVDEDISNPVHLPGGNGPVRSKAENIRAERAARERQEQWRRADEIWQAAQAARVASGLPVTIWSEENQARAEAGLPLLSIMEVRK
jgi:hypothetical protein